MDDKQMNAIEHMDRHPLRVTKDAWDLFGHLARMPAIAILQFLEMSRQSGVVVLEAPGVPQGRCALLDGRFLEASFGHLRGPDAVLAMLDLKEGTIGFRVVDINVEEDTPRYAVSPLIMESVRLEDEFERVSADFPDHRVRLELSDRNEVPVDPLGCGIDTVMVALLARPGRTVRQLEEMLALAPSKVRLAVAWLASTNRLHVRRATGASSGTLMASNGTKGWYFELLQVRPGGLRILFGLGAGVRDHEVIAAVRGLAKELGAAPAWISIAPDGSAVARVRPRAGGLLSIACLPAHPQHTPTFAGFARSADLVLLCSDAPPEIASEWKQHMTVDVPMLRLDCGSLRESFHGALKQHAATLLAMRAEEDQWAVPTDGV